MTEAVQLQLIITAGGVLIIGIPSVLGWLSASRAEKISRAAKIVTEETGRRIDGRMDELLELTRHSAAAQATLVEKERGEGLAKDLLISQKEQP